ncbi:MAG: hypothetical protein ACR2K3_02100, partial [Nocardioides sp.]
MTRPDRPRLLARPPAPATTRAATRAAALVATLVATVVGTLVAVPGAAHAATSDEDSAPLQVSVATLAPSTIPRTGRVTLTGRITNRSDQVWTDLNVYLLTSPTPITTRSDLAEASQ